MNVTRYVVFYLIVLVGLLLFFCSDSGDVDYTINEEATPIRDYEEIKGMLYTIDVSDEKKEEDIDVFSKMLSSIYHYKDINNIDSFFIDLKVDENYKIDDMSIIDMRDDSFVKKVNYNIEEKDTIINLDRSDFDLYNTNYDIKIKLKRNARKI